MGMIVLLIRLFIVSFLINLLWEVIHSQLYDTCLNIKLKKYIPLIIKMSMKDGFWITLFYYTAVLVSNDTEILNDTYSLALFIILALTFSFICETVSLKRGRWKYSDKMPTIFGVGITPLLELAVTGILSFIFLFS